jgi:hypothetical protein
MLARRAAPARRPHRRTGDWRGPLDTRDQHLGAGGLGGPGRRAQVLRILHAVENHDYRLVAERERLDIAF